MCLDSKRTASLEPAVLPDQIGTRRANADEHRAYSSGIQGGTQEPRGLAAHLERAVAAKEGLRLDQHSEATCHRSKETPL